MDYLLNHDGADAAGSSLLLTGLAQYEHVAGDLALQSTWTGGGTTEMVISTFCVEALPPPLPGNDTTGGSADFADYQSCNNQPDKSAPTCGCAVAIDRRWGRLPLPTPACHLGPLKSIPCTTSGAGLSSCTCDCTPQQTATSSAYTGMMPVFAIDDEDAAPIGRWYSHSAASACKESEQLGATRADGSRCTWKMQPNARVMRGWQLYAAGLNATGLAAAKVAQCAASGPSCSPLAAQIRQNKAVMEKVLDSAPLAPWRCGAS